MDIVLLSTGAYPVELDGVRSVETSIFMLARELTNKGHFVNIIDIPSSHHADNNNLYFTELTSDRAPYVARVLSFSGRLIKYLLDDKSVLAHADVIQSYSQFTTLATYLARSVSGKWAKNIPLFHVACSPYLVTPPSLSKLLTHTIVEKQALRRADRVVIHTESGVKTITSRYGISKEKAVAIPAGVDMSLVRNNKPVGKVLLCPGVVTSRKNQMVVVKAMPKILAQHPDALLMFVGPIEDTRYHRKLLDATSKLGADSHVKFTGKVSREKMFQMYGDASVMVFPTTFEMQGIVMVEAMACGLPVVASDIDVIRDVSGHSGALLADPDDFQAFADNISAVLNDAGLRGKLAAGGKEIAQRYSWERISEDFEKEYAKCCAI